MEPLGENFREYRTVDKSGWKRGDWDDEPDKAQWIDAETGLDCLIVRNRSGALCGYVGVWSDHPMFEKGYNEVDVEVHGGLTFADKCADYGDESRFICHVPAPGRPDHVWWFGFDCAHAFDISPAYQRDAFFAAGYEDEYRDFAYVVGQVRSLAAQLKAIAK